MIRGKRDGWGDRPVAVVRPQDMGPEHKVLLSCAAAVAPDDPQTSLRSALDEGPDWRVLADLADWHRISPLLFTRLRRSDLHHLLPPDLMGHFEAAYYTTAARAAHYERELMSVLDTLHGAGIPIMLLKGSALIPSAYLDSALRSMSDLDLLVPDSRIGDAERALEAKGWASEPAKKGALEMRATFRHIPPMYNPGSTVSVELHRELVSPPLRWDRDRVWKRAIEAKGIGPALLPAPEDLLAHVALHFFMDRHETRPGALRQLIDIAVMVHSHPSLDWDLLLEEGGRNDTVGALACALWTSHHLLAVPVPEWVVHAATSDEAGADAFIRQRVLGHSAWPLAGLIGPDEDYRIARAVRNALRRLFPTRHYLRSRYADSSRVPLAWPFLHLRDLALRWRKSMARPGSVRQGLMADRWLHSLLERGTKP